MIAKLIRAIKGTVFTAIASMCLLGISSVTGYVSPRVLEIERVKHVPVEAPPADMAWVLAETTKCGIRPEVVMTLISNENNGRLHGQSRKCEMKSTFWLKAATEAATAMVKRGEIQQWEFEEQRDAMRCSYGPFQIAGWWAPVFGMTWADLTDVKKSTKAFCGVWEQSREYVLRTYENLTPYEEYWSTYKKYNGDGPDAEKYADKAMEKLSEIAFAKVFG